MVIRLALLKPIMMASVFLLLLLPVMACAQEKPAPEKQLRLIPAFIIDDRLSVLRRDPRLQAEVMRRLRLARPVYLIEAKAARADEPKFYRVAISRRTRGWLHEAALAVPGRPGEDTRLLKMIETFSDTFERLTLCRLFVDHFGYSRRLPRVLMLMAEAAERAAADVSRNAHRRLKNLTVEASGASVRDYYLSDTGIDRYTRLRIRFDYREKASAYVYDGQAYREIVRRFPKSEEAGLARQKLAQNSGFGGVQ